MALTSKQRAALRSAANTIDPVFQIGKGEIDDTLIQGLADCIAARELIKTASIPPAKPPTPSAKRWTASACRSSAVSSCCSRKRRKKAPSTLFLQNNGHGAKGFVVRRHV